MLNKKITLTVSSFISMYFLGVGGTIIGAAAKNIGLSPYQIGIILAVQNTGFIISVVLSGSLSDSMSKTRLLSIGSFILAVSFILFYRVPDFLINSILMFFIGFGTGIYEGTTDPMMLEIHETNKSLYINVNHFFVNIGSLTITVYLIFLSLNWRKATIQAGILVLLLAILYLFLNIDNQSISGLSLLKRLKHITKDLKRLVILFILTVLAVGLETSIIGILTSFLMDIRGFTQITSKIGLIIFISGIASGRLLIGYISKKFKLLPILMVFLISGSFIFLVLFFMDIGSFAYFIIYLSGFSISVLLPILITITGLIYPDMSGTALGLIKMGIPVGGIVIPLIISILTKYWNFRQSLIIFPIIWIIGFSLIFLNYKSLKKSLLVENAT